ncbi:restriction endonuclease subunit S [Bacillus cereus]|uniref:restriction endonuclease subunit S n=1 Tax=Bacillus cereus TaxID=1396 RepID=UPI0024531B7A|nr:restriction endonuclease subunit S [Bacillus cereus]MDH4424341.1 restriction endonuclease subunit S [Bacillus cereus]
MKIPKLRFLNFNDDLHEKKLGSIVDIFRGSSPRPKADPKFYGGPIPRLMIEDVTRDGKYVTPKVDSLTLEGAKKSRFLTKGSLVLSCSGTRVAIPGILNVDACIHDGFFGFKNFKELDKEYLFYFFEKLHESIQSSATKGATFNNLTTEIMKTMSFVLPSQLEQKKIASFFRILDKRIKLQQEKIDLLKEQKKGYLLKIFNQEIRLKDNNGIAFPKWSEVKISDILSSKDIRQIPSNEAPLMAFTSSGGIESKGDRYNREFLVKNPNKTYKRTDFNDLIYSSNNLDVGAIGRNKYGSSVISDVYEVFEVKDGYKAEFIEILIQQKSFLSKILKFRQGALYGQYRIHASDFLSVSVLVPSFGEQVKLSNFIMKLDLKLSLETDKLETLIKQKQAFMQQMFI